MFAYIIYLSINNKDLLNHTPSPKQANLLFKRLGIIGGITLLIIVSLYFTYNSNIKVQPKSLDQQLPSNQINKNSQVKANEDTSHEVSPTIITDYKTYTSVKLKLRFEYKPKVTNNDNVLISEEKDRVYIYVDTSPENKQYVQVFQKNPKDDINQAIFKATLNGYSAYDCLIETPHGNTKIPASNINIASIHYNTKNKDKSTGFIPNDSSKCPEEYTETTDNEYFIVDKNHPDKLLFFKIGGFGLEANIDNAGHIIMWQDTLTLL